MKIPSPRTSLHGSHFGASRDSLTIVPPWELSSSGALMRVNPRSALTSRSRSTSMTSASRPTSGAGGPTARSLKSG
jgi:hypothetical protein